MCPADQDFHLINKNTQVALYSESEPHCEPHCSILWNIYYSRTNFSRNQTEWAPFDMNTSSDKPFYGMNGNHHDNTTL